ncbi:DNA (cytosine-5)-methyltransferase 1 [Pilibacter termitis]|uniref:Cytosine-specific methyltransferase n=1 Tax=Pilibacter termitis TaxID=263852 RepID=A0A1T4K8F4_9ENTE|nr:DNA (cytosine-5-)-methyltransferase [Pilibacter termitis]SJZ38605.1 DNA (cytosine-5)-methyltransferase 1 [Pilibacter termitis]
MQEQMTLFEKEPLKFMDFCSGIGGGRLGLARAGLFCVGHSEINQAVDENYQLFFQDGSNFGDLMEINSDSLPDFDVLVSGFPCQTFSIVGKRQGFEDERGLVITGLVKILKEKNIPCFIFENVKGLVNHDKGRTLKIILNMLKELDYDVEYQVLNSVDFGVPQMRERIYIVGIKKYLKKRQMNWLHEVKRVDLKEFLDEENRHYLSEDNETFLRYLNNKYNKGKYNISDLLKNDYLVLDTRQSDLRLYEGKVPTLRNGRHGILYVRDKKFVKISAYEGMALQGFPKEIIQLAKNNKIGTNKLLSQVGNAMTVNVMEFVTKRMLEAIE